MEQALHVETFRRDGDEETEFVTISYWPDFDAMAAFTGAAPDDIHHLPRDEEFLIELPQRVEIYEIRRHGRGRTRSGK